MPLDAQWPAFAGLQQKLDKLSNPDVAPVLDLLEKVIREDNRRGVLAGQDRDGKPMRLTYRQQNVENRWVTRKVGGKVIRFKMLGSAEGGDGPALAPHREASRVIENLRTAFFMDGPGRWVVIGAWEDVLGDKGVPFLPFHFRGEGFLPERRLDGLRPDGFQDAFNVVDQWADALLGGP